MKNNDTQNIFKNAFPRIDYSEMFGLNDISSKILANQFATNNNIIEQISKTFTIPKIPVPSFDMSEIMQSFHKPFELNFPKFENPFEILSKQLQQNSLAHLTRNIENPLLESLKHMESLNQGVLASLKLVNESFAAEISSAITRLNECPELLTELIVENSNSTHNPYILRSILEYLRFHSPELFLKWVVIPMALSVILYKPLEKVIDEKVVSPNICIARSGCRIREDGTVNSRIKIAIPSGSEILVLENHGRWKKIYWQNELGESYEGWISSSLLEWKWKKQLKGKL